MNGRIITQQRFKTLRLVSNRIEQELEYATVLVAEVEKKNASEAIKELNTIYPLPTLRHLRRLRSVGRSGTTVLEILLCTVPCVESFSTPNELKEIIERYKWNPRIAQVGLDPQMISMDA